MKKVLVVAVVAALAGCATTGGRTAPVTLEFRPGSESPGPGLTEMTLAGSERSVYVSEQVVLSNAEVKSARVVSGQGGPQVDIVFTETGAERFARATEQSIMKPLAILVDGKLLSAPIVRETITGGRAVIAGRFTEQEAKRIADGIVGR